MRRPGVGSRISQRLSQRKPPCWTPTARLAGGCPNGGRNDRSNRRAGHGRLPSERANQRTRWRAAGKTPTCVFKRYVNWENLTGLGVRGASHRLPTFLPSPVSWHSEADGDPACRQVDQADNDRLRRAPRADRPGPSTNGWPARAGGCAAATGRGRAADPPNYGPGRGASGRELLDAPTGLGRLLALTAE